MAAQSIRADKGYLTIIQGGGSDYLDYSKIRKMKEETQPGEFVTSAGETAGNPVALAVAGDDDTGTVELVLYRVGCIPQSVDTALDANQFGMCLGPNGKRFTCAAWRKDESTSILKGQKLTLSSVGGQLATWAYSATADPGTFLAELAEDSADVASTAPIVLIKF